MSGELPSGWALAALSELLAPLEDGRVLHHGWSPQCEKEPSGSDSEWGVLKTTAIQDGAFLPEHNKLLPRHLTPRPQFEVRMGDLLITCAGPRARCGVPCLVRRTRPRLMLSGKMYRFRVPDRFIEGRYVEGWLRTSTAQATIDRMKTGISDSGLNLTHDRFLPLPVPLAPIPEQHRIVEAIESYFTRLDDAVATLERVQRNLKRYRASVLKAAVEGRLVPTEAELARVEGRDYEPASVLLARILVERRRRWEASGRKGKYQEPVGPDTSGLPELPEGWCWSTVQGLTATTGIPICAGPFGTIFKARDFRPVGVPIIFLRHVKPDRYLPLHKPTFMLQSRWDEFFKDYSVYGGELLVTKLGDPPGDCAIYPSSVGPAMLTPDVMKLAVDLELAEPRFVMHYMNSVLARQFVFGSAFGTTRLRLTLPLFRSMPVPLPPLAEQRRISQEVDQLLTIAEMQQKAAAISVARLARLRQSILKWAFEGKLANQDPNDEPASVLLARIKAEREAAASATKRNGRPARRARVTA